MLDIALQDAFDFVDMSEKRLFLSDVKIKTKFLPQLDIGKSNTFWKIKKLTSGLNGNLVDMLSSISKPFVTAAASFRLLQLFFLASELFLEDTIGPQIAPFGSAAPPYSPPPFSPWRETTLEEHGNEKLIREEIV